MRGFYHKDMKIVGSSNRGSLRDIFLKSNVSSGKGKMVIIYSSYVGWLQKWEVALGKYAS
jgi:hypothetical protein